MDRGLCCFDSGTLRRGGCRVQANYYVVSISEVPRRNIIWQDSLSAATGLLEDPGIARLSTMRRGSGTLSLVDFRSSKKVPSKG